jgi:hypothetical protein
MTDPRTAVFGDAIWLAAAIAAAGAGLLVLLFWHKGRRISGKHVFRASRLSRGNLFFSDVLIESSGGTSPVRCHGHRKADAIEMKRLIEQYQSDYLSRTR